MTISARYNNKVILEKPNVPLFQRYISQCLRTHLQVMLLLPSSEKQYFQLPFPACYNNKVPGWRVENESGLFKISSILICQRYAIDSLFQKFDTCFVVFTETFLVLYFFRLLLLEHSRLFSSREFLFFLDNPKMIQMLSILGEKLVWRKKKNTVTKSTHKYRQNRWGVELRPQLHVRRRLLPLHLVRVSSPPPRKFLMNIQASIDCRSYHYAGLPCNAAPQFKAPWEDLTFKFLTKFFRFPAACSFLNKVHISLWYSVEGLLNFP